LIQLDVKDDELEELPVATVEQLYNEKITIAKTLMLDKNHDYGEAWREMSQESFCGSDTGENFTHQTDHYQ